MDTWRSAKLFATTRGDKDKFQISKTKIEYSAFNFIHLVQFIVTLDLKKKLQNIKCLSIYHTVVHTD